MPMMTCDDRFSGSTSSWWSSGTPCTTPTGTTYTSCFPTRLGLDHLQHHLVGERLAHHHVHVDQRELPDSRVQLEGAGSDLINNDFENLIQQVWRGVLGRSNDGVATWIVATLLLPLLPVLTSLHKDSFSFYQVEEAMKISFKAFILLYIFLDALASLGSMLESHSVTG